MYLYTRVYIWLQHTLISDYRNPLRPRYIPDWYMNPLGDGSRFFDASSRHSDIAGRVGAGKPCDLTV